MTADEKKRQESFDRLVNDLRQLDENPLVPKRDKHAVSDFIKPSCQPGFCVELHSAELGEVAAVHARLILDDPELHPDFAVSQAIDVLDAWLALTGHSLDGTEGRPATSDPDVLGCAGEIFRLRWERTARWADLWRAWSYNSRGSEATSPDGRRRRPEIFNAFFSAFLLDQIAKLEELALSDHSRVAGHYGFETVDVPDRTGGNRIRGGTYAQLHDQADQLRDELLAEAVGVAESDPEDWEMEALVGAIHFARGDWDQASSWIKKVPEPSRPPADDLKLQKWIREFVSLAHTRRESVIDEPHAQEVLAELLPVEVDNVGETLLGKLGLALSGGGFRAALYHIGVLARLAEADLLRRVEVLSCVSGGSIVGVHYTMLLKQLFETRPDACILDDPGPGAQLGSRNDPGELTGYFDVVHRLIDDFTTGVRRDYRNRLFSNPLATLRMLGAYSPAERLGTQLEKRLLPTVRVLASVDGARGRVEDRRLRDGRLTTLNQLRIQPRRGDADWDGDFSPKLHNWRRRNRIPILVLNATTVNTGHNWQFTARHMGEPPAIINPEIDPAHRLRRVKWTWNDHAGDAAGEPAVEDETVTRGAGAIRVGRAVAASAAVPGLFPALPIPDRYPDWLVKLVDGGVVDNQGIVGLVEGGCRGIIVSDASGMLTDAADPLGGLVGLWRSAEISKAQIRNRQYDELRTRTEAGLLRGFTYVHLSHGLHQGTVAPRGDRDPGRSTSTTGRVSEPAIDPEVAEDLARVRTDLDVFSEAEAYALMCAGYKSMDAALIEQSVEDRERDRARAPWAFLTMEPVLDHPDQESHRKILRHIGRSRYRVFRSRIHLVAALVALAVGGVAAVGAVMADVDIVRSATNLTAGVFVAWAVLTTAALALRSPRALRSWRRAASSADNVTSRRVVVERWLVGSLSRGLMVLMGLTVGLGVSWALLGLNKLAYRYSSAWSGSPPGGPTR